MLRAVLLTACLLVAPSCVLGTDHVRTELVAVCARDVPLLFERDSGSRSIAAVTVEDLGATLDDPDARVVVDTIVVELVAGVDDLSFTDSLQLDVSAPGGELPTARPVDAAVTGELPMTAVGDPSVNLIEYLVAETLAVQVTLAGDSPVDQFLAELSVCLDVSGLEISDK